MSQGQRCRENVTGYQNTCQIQLGMRSDGHDGRVRAVHKLKINKSVVFYDMSIRKHIAVFDEKARAVTVRGLDTDQPLLRGVNDLRKRRRGLKLRWHLIVQCMNWGALVRVLSMVQGASFDHKN